ncbi:hypothetical protein EK21DRAFT_98486 [Setomelanomma holmii]|uniref:Carboxylic ester hydrolase n=1 Tax=Setomelanomma holmii TaxID=210430 RepID=A0A9P4HEU0_9PLEO|nr:hypothetical protein EK21DRAFT_98486 [Setomelanomma holmii]
MFFRSLVSVLAISATSFAAQLTQVSNYSGSAKAKPGMWTYVPDQVKSDALVVAIHSCQFSAQKYLQNSLILWKKGSDTKGYVTVWPSSTTECWDVSSKSSLSHNGGGDSNVIANMITYAIDKYQIDSKKVFVTGGSSGAMMSNVLIATYPELITAVSLYSGVPAGCFVSSSGASAAWNNTCSGGQSISTAQHWGDAVREIYPGYNGTRPRMHGSVDSTLSPKNYDETLKQWTNVFGNYRTDDFGPNVQGIWAHGVGHSVPSQLTVSQAWFGL